MAKSPARAALAAQAAKPQRLNYDQLDELLGFRLRMAHIALYREFMSALSNVEVTQRQVAVLWLVGANPGISQGELGAALAMDSATMVAVIDRLAREGRLVRRQSESDRRRRELHLTPAGIKTLKGAKAAIGRLEKRAAAGLSESELQALLATLGKLAGLDDEERSVDPAS
jgi:DNA-binding MarR family transcriptional regulator